MITVILLSDGKNPNEIIDSISILRDYIKEIHVVGVVNDDIRKIQNIKIIETQLDKNSYKDVANASVSKVTTKWVITFLPFEYPTDGLAAILQLIAEYSNDGKYYESARFLEVYRHGVHIFPPHKGRSLMHIKSRNPYVDNNLNFVSGMFARFREVDTIYIRDAESAPT